MASQTSEKDVGSSAPKTLPEFRSSDLPSGPLLGKGLCGIVYETTWKGERYARKDFVEVPKEVFQDEASVLIGLEEHKNIVKTSGLTVDDRSCSLVLEYMDDDLLSLLQKRKESKRSQAGKGSENLPEASSLIDSSLHKFIEERRKNPVIPDTSPPPLELQEALDVMLQIATGMAYLHERNVAHGDLKPRNVLVSYSNEEETSVKVADFGLVQTKSKSMFFVSRGERKLDMAQWKAPEYLDTVFGHKLDEKYLESDSDEDVDTASLIYDYDWLCRADVYSFGVTCFQILTGEVPYANLNWKELVDEIVSQGLRPKLPVAFQSKLLNDLLDSCWGSPSRLRPTFPAICNKLLEIIRLETTVGDENPPSVPPVIPTVEKPSVIPTFEKPPVIPEFKNPYPTTPPYAFTGMSGAKHPNLGQVSVSSIHTGDVEYGMGAGMYHGVHLGLTESDIERNEGIDINYEDDALQPYDEVKSLLWIKRNTVYSVALGEWDRKVLLLSYIVDKKEKRSRELKNKIYQLIGIFLLLQGVLLTAVTQIAQSSNQNKNCKKVWSPVILTALVWAVTIVGVWQKLSRIQVIDDECSEEDEARREAVRRANILRNCGRSFKFRDLKEKMKARPCERYFGFGCHFWINRFGVIVITLSVFTGIFIASHFLVLCNRGV